MIRPDTAFDIPVAEASVVRYVQKQVSGCFMSMMMILESLSAKQAETQQLSASASLSVFEDQLSEDRGDEGSVSLEKAWHGLHFLLTGDAWGGSGWRAFLLHGGSEQGEDMGYGPSRIFEPEEVVAIQQMLDGISADALWSDSIPSRWRTPKSTALTGKTNRRTSSKKSFWTTSINFNALSRKPRIITTRSVSR